MLAFAAQAMPDWNAGSEGDFGVMMVELFAYAADILSYYGDRVGQEAYLPTATQMVSLLNISQLLGYVPSNGLPASGTVTFQTPDPGVTVTVPALTQVSTAFNAAIDQPIIYETQAPLVVAGNGGTATAAVIQGITMSNVVLGVSTGYAGQIFTLPQQGVIDGTTSVFLQTATGTSQWTQVQYIINNGPGDTVFTIFTDALGNTNIQFGDNVNGMIPALGMTVTATYRVGVGAAGNVAAGVVGLLASNFTGAFVPFLSDGVTYNSSAMTGGAAPETADQIRANAPVSFRTQQRAVSVADFGAMALSVPGVIAANAAANHSTSVSIYILAAGATSPTTTLIENVEAYFVGKTLAGVSLSVLPPNLIPVDVGSVVSPITVYVAPNYSQLTVMPLVTAALTALLTPPNTTFAQLLTASAVYDAVTSVAGVEWVNMTVITREDIVQTGITPIQFRASEIPIPGNFYVTPAGGF
jgi:Baseplate J-like protein